MRQVVAFFLASHVLLFAPVAAIGRKPFLHAREQDLANMIVKFFRDARPTARASASELLNKRGLLGGQVAQADHCRR
ncbi:MAG: hypothetical protein U5N27_21290 [Rhizobium sp.]|nr:hypothetical protein [Rhizobium sp.]